MLLILVIIPTRTNNPILILKKQVFLPPRPTYPSQIFKEILKLVRLAKFNYSVRMKDLKSRNDFKLSGSNQVEKNYFFLFFLHINY